MQRPDVDEFKKSRPPVERRSKPSRKREKKRQMFSRKVGGARLIFGLAGRWRRICWPRSTGNTGPFHQLTKPSRTGVGNFLRCFFFFGHGNIEPAGGICSTCRRPSSGACIDHGEAAADDSDSALPAVDQRARIVQRRLQSEFAPPQGRSEPINYRAESAAKLDAATRETHEMVAFRTLSGQTAALISDEFSGSQSPFGSCFFRQQTSDHVDERVG